jgi:MarR-like DNA-binding transcriptional regulator SgrR of sgrS sRNA
MTANLLTLNDIATMHHCSIRHTHDVLARINKHQNINTNNTNIH